MGMEIFEWRDLKVMAASHDNGRDGEISKLSWPQQQKPESISHLTHTESSLIKCWSVELWFEWWRLKSAGVPQGPHLSSHCLFQSLHIRAVCISNPCGPVSVTILLHNSFGGFPLQHSRSTNGRPSALPTVSLYESPSPSVSSPCSIPHVPPPRLPLSNRSSE